MLCSPVYLCTKLSDFKVSDPILTLLLVTGILSSPPPPPPKATQTCHLLECALLSPIPVKSGMNSDTSTMVAATLQEKQRKGSPPQGPLPPGSAPCTQNTSPSTYHYLLHTGHCSLPIPHHIMFIYMFLPFGGLGFLHKKLTLSICLSRSYLCFKTQLKPFLVGSLPGTLLLTDVILKTSIQYNLLFFYLLP